MDQQPLHNAQTGTAARALTNAFLRSVYNWMFIGLLCTAATAWYILNDTELYTLIVSNRLLLYGLLFSELGLVVAISWGISRISAGTATFLFVLYSALNGLTLGVIVSHFTQASVVSAFLTAAGMFAGMSLYALVTKRDLSGWRSFLVMGLIGVLIALIVNIWLASPMLHFIISIAGVIVFTGLTAYDTQKIRELGESAPLGDATALRRGAILGALTLYLDFINLFIMLLRLMGERR